MPTATSLLADALRTTAPTPRYPARSALAIGTVGRIGEALINSLLEHPDYATVHVAVEAPLRSTLPRLRPWRIDPNALVRQDSVRQDSVRQADASGIALPPTDDVYCCVDGSRSYFGRDRAYFPVPAQLVPALARLAARSGARRLILLSPLPAHLQPSAPAGGAMHVRELELLGLGFETLVILRPTTDYATNCGNALARLVAWGAKAVMEIVIPQSLQPLRPRQIAQAAIHAATLGPGVHMIGGARIARLAPDQRRR